MKYLWKKLINIKNEWVWSIKENDVDAPIKIWKGRRNDSKLQDNSNKVSGDSSWVWKIKKRWSKSIPKVNN